MDSNLKVIAEIFNVLEPAVADLIRLIVEAIGVGDHARAVMLAKEAAERVELFAEGRKELDQ